METGDDEAEEAHEGDSVRPGVEDRRDRGEVSPLVLWKEIHLGVVLNGVRGLTGLIDVFRGVKGA